MILRPGDILGGLCILFFAWVAYFSYAHHAGARRAAEFCRPIAIGSSIDGLVERAIASGAHQKWPVRWHPEPHGSESLSVMFPGATVDRHVCRVLAKEGRVVSTEVLFLD